MCFIVQQIYVKITSNIWTTLFFTQLGHELIISFRKSGNISIWWAIYYHNIIMQFTLWDFNTKKLELVWAILIKIISNFKTKWFFNICGYSTTSLRCSVLTAELVAWYMQSWVVIRICPGFRLLQEQRIKGYSSRKLITLSILLQGYGHWNAILINYY